MDFKEVWKWYGRGANPADAPLLYKTLKRRKARLTTYLYLTYNNSIVPPLEKLKVQEIVVKK